MSEHTKMTKKEAGRQGGEVRADKTPAELSKQAKKSANTVEQSQHSGFHSEIGKNGRVGVLVSPDYEEQYEDDEDLIE